MTGAANRQALVAVDLGAQSCRVSLLRWLPQGPRIQLVYRTSNAPVEQEGTLRWDLAALCAAADEGLRRCAEIAEEGIASIGVSGWAVDYVRLQPPTSSDAISEAAANPFCYRDPRTAPAMEALHQRIPAEKIYARTGIQVLPLNSVYQLHADCIAGLPNHLRWLNLPEYMLYRWGARPVAEYTNATHTGLIDLETQHWSPEMFSAIGLDPATAPEIVKPGTIVGTLQGPLAQLPALAHTLLIAPACHDTASAIAGIDARAGAHNDAPDNDVPANDSPDNDSPNNDWAFISSGTWSLVGTLLDQPCAGIPAARANFTNLGGVGGKICFLRNVNGLWLLQQCMETWTAQGDHFRLEELLETAGKLPAPKFLLDVDDPNFVAPGDMPARINTQLRDRHGAPDQSSPAAIVSLILHSLAARYAELLRQIQSLTGKKFQRLYIVGGGSKNILLNRLTQQATGLEVICGAQESTTVGNFAIQMAALDGLHAGVVRQSPVTHLAVAHWAGVLCNSIITPSSPASS